jgi:MFS superfamily sulfate permease-like transporter
MNPRRRIGTGGGMTTVARRVLPGWLRGYRREWASRDIIAGVTLAAVAIPECMGYTSIAQTPIATGLYTVIFPTIVFALLGSSKLLVVGADSATAAILAAGLAGLGVAGLTPDSPEWVAFTSLTALVYCGWVSSATSCPRPFSSASSPASGSR